MTVLVYCFALEVIQGQELPLNFPAMNILYGIKRLNTVYLSQFNRDQIPTK